MTTIRHARDCTGADMHGEPVNARGKGYRQCAQPRTAEGPEA